jgi:hypothetical protein
MKNKDKIITIIAGFCILLSCSNNGKTSQRTDLSNDSIKCLILAKENATLKKWYNGDPMGFIDNSWEDVTYFDPSLLTRADSIETFRKVLAPIIG